MWVWLEVGVELLELWVELCEKKLLHNCKVTLHVYNPINLRQKKCHFLSNFLFFILFQEECFHEVEPLPPSRKIPSFSFKDYTSFSSSTILRVASKNCRAGTVCSPATPTCYKHFFNMFANFDMVPSIFINTRI